jgi:Golgi phosphoprotein 3 GPP34
MTSIADELLLLGYDDAGEPAVGQPALDYALSGAVLVELALAGRIGISDKRVDVLQDKPTGDEIVDDALARIAADDKRRKPNDWIGRLSDGLREKLLARQVEAGVLRREKGKVLWVFPHTTYPTVDGETPEAEVATRHRLAAVLDSTERIEPRTAALCGLVVSSGMERKVFPDRPAKEVRKRLKAIADGDWASAAVKSAIDEVHGAIIVASTAATTGAVVASSS